VDIAQTDARYLRNTGIVLSNASTTFNDTVDIVGLCTVYNINTSSLVDTKDRNVSALATVQDITVTGVHTYIRKYRRYKYKCIRKCRLDFGYN
jgi:hypothetical protein